MARHKSFLLEEILDPFKDKPNIFYRPSICKRIITPNFNHYSSTKIDSILPSHMIRNMSRLAVSIYSETSLKSQQENNLTINSKANYSLKTLKQ